MKGVTQLLQRYQTIFTALNEYLTEYQHKGFDSVLAESFRELIGQSGDTPLDRIFQVFDCDSFDRCAVTLSLLIASGKKAAGVVSVLCGKAEGCLTAGIVSELFFGWEDIIPFYRNLMPDAPLDRLLNGVCSDRNSALSVRDYIAAFAFTGAVQEEAFDFTQTESKIYLSFRSSEQAQQELMSFLRQADRNLPFLLQMIGEAGSGRRTVLHRVGDMLGERLLPIDISRHENRLRVKELADELFLLGAVPVVMTGAEREETAVFLHRLAQEVGLVIAVAEEEFPHEQWGEDSLTIRLNKPDLSEQYRFWQEMSRSYVLDDDVDFAELTGEFDMTPQEIKRALYDARLLSSQEKLTLADLKTGCYRSFASDMGSRAVKLNCVFGWQDIVLPERSRQRLSEACDQVRLRHMVYHHWGFEEKMPYGRGISMIFTGPPGTGKTMGAQVMAKELGMDIYRISLANVVSKYIGETEKNLNEIFEKGKRCRAILFFDEADVLFARRTEVKDANDKYSNMEAAFLLQKMEEYNGIVILATNLVQNFDEAFKRRMRFIIDFPFPDAAHRRQLWEKAFPRSVPLSDIDWDFLVEQYELSGSNIRNIALHSAFLAAAEHSGSVGMKQILLSVRNEFAKIGKAFTKTEAGEYYYLLNS